MSGKAGCKQHNIIRVINRKSNIKSDESKLSKAYNGSIVGIFYYYYYYSSYPNV